MWVLFIAFVLLILMPALIWATGTFINTRIYRSGRPAKQIVWPERETRVPFAGPAD